MAPVTITEAVDIEHEDIPHTPSKRRRALHLSKSIKEKTKRLIVDILPDQEEDNSEDDIFTDAAFDSSAAGVTVDKDSDGTPGDEDDNGKANKAEGPMSNVVSSLKTASVSVIHPRRAMRKKATRTAAGKLSMQTNLVSVDDQLALLDAQDDLEQLSSDPSSVQTDDDSTELTRGARARQHVERLENRREGLETAWILSRHVNRVRAVQPISKKPRKEDYTISSEGSGTPHIDWQRWLVHGMLWYTSDFTSQYIDDTEHTSFDIKDIARIIERIMVVSAPWQAFLLDVRRVYVWEDRRRTLRWMALYFVLWYMERIADYCYGYIIYMVLRKRFYSESIESVRASIRKSRDQGARGQAWSDLVQQHGNKDWVEPLLEALGPTIQTELSDFADFLEVLANFYRWELPRKTWATLFFYTCCFIVTVTTDVLFVVKLTWFIIGVVFFFSWPIKTRFPKYRQLVPAARWVYWDIPTHAELAIIRLQEKAILAQADMLRRDEALASEASDSLTPESAESEICADPFSQPQNDMFQRKVVSFRVVKNNVHGRISVTRLGFWYHDKQEQTFFPFNQLIEIRKVDATSKMERWTSLQVLPCGLQFLVREHEDGPCLTLTLTVSEADRDEILSLMLGSSNRKWQVLQLNRHHPAQHDVSMLDKTIKRALG